MILPFYYYQEEQSLITGILFLVVLIALNAFFAASEIALISLNDNKIRMMAEDGDKKAKILTNLLGEPSRFLATIQIGITLAGFLASAFASENFSDPLVSLLIKLGVPVSASLLKTIAVILITIILSYFTLVLGELVPKRIAMNKAEKIAWFAASPLYILSKIASPFVKMLTASMNVFVRLLGVDPNAENEQVTEEEIRMMVDVGEEKGAIHETEKLMINNIFEFNNKTVSEVMTHRTDIAALPIEASLSEVIAFINHEKYSRIPVYEENIDNIVGVLQSKYLFQYLTNNSNPETFHLRDVVREPYYVPDSKRTDELFKELQLNKTHLAVIIDEYGGTAGIVTLEDLIEEIVGNIFDEDDEVELEFEKIDENTYMINGATSLDAVQDYLGVELPIEEYETLSGFLVGQLGRIPGRDDKPSLEFNSLMFKVEEVDEKRIAKVKVCRL
ncbi:hemolysin [Dehalobacter sp. MCB1]|uniref:hemolysin family protein n=1 Tax=unclassified Dehalobacter TaxID=2635733 RepID=UPI00037AF074|nr:MULTISPECIES: hemolysin family protein [unclassified Dehalobacter]RJE47019.1 hemolysin [Dehalobacter sp. MCB1]TCX50961.1 HlyC/CorC family transporter [Dehalobacter sp. 12DCB1]